MSNFFRVKTITDLETCKLGDIVPESDFASLTPSGKFVQLEYVENSEVKEKLQVKPGIYTIVKTMSSLKLQTTSFVEDKILKEFINTKNITDKIDVFFSRLHVYKKHNIEVPKRSALIYGPAGTGKTASMVEISRKYGNDKTTAIVVWPTDKFEAHQVKDLIKSFEYVGVTRLIAFIEDIGGVEIDQVRMKSDSSLLSLLDNQEKTFTIPVYILATTNHPEVFLGNLTNRPGRFDDKIEVGYPKAEERATLLNFFTENTASIEAIELMQSSSTKEFSIAHIKDAVLRADLYDISLEQAIRQMLEEIELYKKAFSKKQNVGIGFDDD